IRRLYKSLKNERLENRRLSETLDSSEKLGNLLGRSEPTQAGIALHGFDEFGRHSLAQTCEDARIDHPGPNRVGPDAMAALFTRKPTNQRLDASLGRCGQDVEWRVPLDTGRCHSDEGTTAIRPHERQYGPDDMKKPVEFRFDGQMPFLQINAAHIGHGNIGSGRKDKRMQSIKAFSELPDGVHHCLGISQIHAQGMRPHAKRG
ncbi:MAG: hypothetical protein WCN85_10265, partial [Burkholderiales bacterium]